MTRRRTTGKWGGRLISHEVRPLYRRPRFSRAISYFSTNVGCEEFKDPSIRVLVCHGPAVDVMSIIFECKMATGQSKSNTTSCFFVEVIGGDVVAWSESSCAIIGEGRALASTRMPSIVCTAKASYKKLPGTLELTDSHLQWTQDGKKAPSVRVPHQDASCEPLHVRPSNAHVQTTHTHSALLQQRRCCPGQAKTWSRQR